MRNIAHCRISSEKQVRGFSLDDQEEKRRSGCPNRNHRVADFEARVRSFAIRLIEDPDTLWERMELQARAERWSKPWPRDAREAATVRERLAKLETVGDNYRSQRAEGLIPMTELREKLDEVCAERESLEARLAKPRNAEQRPRELEELPNLVEEFLRDLSYLVDRMPTIREYKVVPPEGQRRSGRFQPFIPTPERIRRKSEEKLETERREAEAARGARFRELHVMLGLRAAAHADGTLEITVGATNTKEVMPCDVPS